MLIYCFKCKRKTNTLNGRILHTINKKAIMKGKCAIWGSKKSQFVKAN